MKDISDVKLKSILKIEKGEKEIKNAKKMLEALFNTSIDLLLFASLSPSALFALMSDFIVDEIIAIY